MPDAAAKKSDDTDREPDKARTWRLIQDLWEHDLALLHSHLIENHSVEHEYDRNGILSATNFRVARAYTPERRDTRAGFRRYYLESIGSEFTDRRRKEGRRVLFCDDEKLIALSAYVETSPSPEDQLIASEERAIQKALLERLRVAINSLPWRQKAALLLWLEEPKPRASEIALALGTTEGAVRQLLYKGRGSLRKQLLAE